LDEKQEFYIGGRWQKSSTSNTHQVINPATELPIATIGMGGPKDVDLAVQSARKAFADYSKWNVEQRLQLLERIIAIYQRRSEELANTVTKEMGAPTWLAQVAQVASGDYHFQQTLAVLSDYGFLRKDGGTAWQREPIGVCGLITPWNWPLNQIVCKIAPALAAGCTMILKPSEMAPLNSILLAEIMEEAGVPSGVFNLINGSGDDVGKALSAHPDVDMMSFTGSTQAGISVAQEAANTIKRVTLELGGKSANILLDDVDLQKSVAEGVSIMMINSGQNCNAPSRMLIPERHYEEAVAIAAETANSIGVAEPTNCSAGSIDPERVVRAGDIGPLANAAQYEKVKQMIKHGKAEGARLVTGGCRPEGMDSGYYLRPTIFANVDRKMAIAQEEIFGPVLCLIPYANEDEAIEIANESKYGLSGYVQSSSLSRAQGVALKMRTGMVHLNGAHEDPAGAFGGYKQSGNGREFGMFGLEEYMEIKSIFGWHASR